MRDQLISIGSITYAMKAKKILSSYLINARVVKAGAGDGRSCIYGIMVSPEELNTVTRLLYSNEIKFSL